MRIKIEWFILATLHQKIGDVIVTQRWFHNTHHRHCFQSQLTHGFSSRIQLTLSAVDHDQVRKRLALFEYSTITSSHHFPHRRYVVRSFDTSNAKLPVFRSVHLSIFTNDHASNILSPLNVRDVK